ncbi:MAG: sigma-70 family RNA polymerase sigma factor [Planctomycetota bacterium]
MSEHDEEDDELNLIRAAIAGNGEAFEAVVNHYAARLRWLIRMRLDPAVRARISADDILQETMLVASKRIGSLVVDNESAFWTWLCRVVEQRLIDVRRQHLQAARRDARREQPRPGRADRSANVRLEDVIGADGTSPSGRLRSVEQREALEAALGRLPASFREVIVLRMIEGLGVQETAAIMGRSPGAISVLLTKAIRRLGREIGEVDPASAGGESR